MTRITNKGTTTTTTTGGETMSPVMMMRMRASLSLNAHHHASDMRTVHSNQCARMTKKEEDSFLSIRGWVPRGFRTNP